MKALALIPVLLFSASAHTGGVENTNYGDYSLGRVTTGSGNAAFGFESLLQVTSGNSNIGIGYFALLNTTTGSGNTVVGADNMINLSTGSKNTSLGLASCQNLETGSGNLCLGADSGLWLPSNTSNAVILGGSSGSTVLNNQVVISDGAGTEKARFTASGNLGIGTINPQATLDINGTARLARFSAEPFACSTTTDGAIALSAAYVTCVCNGSVAAWVSTSDGATACNWTQGAGLSAGQSGPI